MGKGNGRRQISFLKAGAIGLGVSLALGGCLLLLFAKLLSSEKIGEGSMGLLAALLLLLTSLAGALTASLLLGKQKLPVALAVSGSLLVLLVLSGAAFFGGGGYRPSLRRRGHSGERPNRGNPHRRAKRGRKAAL